MTPASFHGHFLWHELMTNDTKAAAAFYTKLLGWKALPSPFAPNYDVFHAGEARVGGLLAIDAEAKAMGAVPAWSSYVGATDVDTTSREAISLGGNMLVPPMDIPKVGRFSVVRDPQGAAFAIFTPAMDGPMANDPIDSEHFAWHELVSSDWQAGFEFYSRLFGWQKQESMDMGPIGTYQMFGFPGKALGGMMTLAPGMAPQSFWLPYLSVPDAKEIAAQIPALGGRVIRDPEQVPGGGWVVLGTDPTSAAFAVHSNPPPAATDTKPVAAAKRAAPKARPTVKKSIAKKRPATKKATPKRPASKKTPTKKRAAARPSVRKTAKKGPAGSRGVRMARKKAKKKS